MVAQGPELTTQWWVSTFPGSLFLTVALAANSGGDGLHDAIHLACGFTDQSVSKSTA